MNNNCFVETRTSHVKRSLMLFYITEIVYLCSKHIISEFRRKFCFAHAYFSFHTPPTTASECFSAVKKFLC